jgi:hypothetical protein
MLSQTAWIVEGERRMVSSIEEIMGNILKKELSATGILTKILILITLIKYN